MTITGSGQQVTIPSGSSVTATITDTYTYLPGSLTVNKVIAGAAAGSQGAVTIEAVCNGTLVGEWTIDAGVAAGNFLAHLERYRGQFQLRGHRNGKRQHEHRRGRPRSAAARRSRSGQAKTPRPPSPIRTRS